MVTMNLRDPNLEKNRKAILEIQSSGLFTDEMIQTMYDQQVKNDLEKENKK